VADGVLPYQAGPPPVLGDQGDPGAQGVGRVADVGRAAAELDRPRIQPVDPEDRPQELALSAAEETGDPEDLARPEFAGHVMDAAVAQAGDP